MARQPKQVETLTHDEAKRKNLPTAEHQPLLDEATEAPVRVAYERRNKGLDPQLVWRGKHLSFEGQDEADPMVSAPPLYIQEKVHPKALIDDLQRESKAREHGNGQITPDLFADFNGLPKGADQTEFTDSTPAAARTAHLRPRSSGIRCTVIPGRRSTSRTRAGSRLKSSIISGTS